MSRIHRSGLLGVLVLSVISVMGAPASAQKGAADPEFKLGTSPNVFPLTTSLTEDLFVSDNVFSGSVRFFPPGGPLSTFFSPLVQPEGLDVDPTTGDVIVSNDTGGGSLTRVASDGSSAVPITGPIGALDDIAVDSAGNIIVARFSSGDILSVSPDGSSVVTLVSGIGNVEELARNPVNGDIFWGTMQGEIGILPGGSCPCSTILAPISVTAMGFDVDDSILGADLVISQFFGDWVYLVDFDSATFTPLVANPGTAEDLAVQNGKIVFPEFFSGAVLEIDVASASVSTLIPAGSINTPTGVDTTAVLQPAEVEVEIDIKPGSCPNSWNRRSNGVLSVAILGTEDFDVTQIDVPSVRIGRADGTGGSVGPNEGPPGPHSKFEDIGTPFDDGQECSCHEAGGDGILDLSMKFRSNDVANMLPVDDPDGALVPLVVSGTLLDGTAFRSTSDCVRLVPPGSPPGQVTVQSIAGGWVDATPLDNQLDGGGFGSFQRTYPHTTVLTLTAPSGHDGNPFVGWELDGGELVQQRTTTFVVNNAAHVAKAVFKKADSCGLGFELALLLAPLRWLYARRRREPA